MVDVKDFTPLRAGRWIAQEAAKHLTADSRAERIAVEQRTIGKSGAIFAGLPNSLWAHRGLIKVLQGGAD